MASVEAYCKQMHINPDLIEGEYRNVFNPQIVKIELRGGDVHIFDSQTLIRLN